ncbi:spore coat protein CotJB [Gottfriedia acidiceleris]|uniref:spore coat protein CotJB n=1 Tax=Gottfriedia acidiceleris TaxID=371036 RepID=UPI000B43ECAD|nr:spore coat protein CotJB [Gottfriedia acidiceleris]
MTEQFPPEYYQYLEELQAVDFVLVELTLYLDTHPDDQNTINQFNQYVQYKKQIEANFESKYGPLYQFGGSYSDQNWNWHKGPWPWQV